MLYVRKFTQTGERSFDNIINVIQVVTDTEKYLEMKASQPVARRRFKLNSNQAFSLHLH